MKISRSPSTGVSSDGPSFPPGGVMIGGALPSLLLDFQPRPKTPRRNWRNVLHQQRLEATLHQHRDANEQDDLGQEEAADFTPFTPHYTLVSSSTCNLTISSMLFSPPPLPWPRYDKGPNDLTPISRPWQPNSIRTRPSTFTIRSPWKPPLNALRDQGVVCCSADPPRQLCTESLTIRSPWKPPLHALRNHGVVCCSADPPKLCTESPKGLTSPSRTGMSCAVRGLSSP